MTETELHALRRDIITAIRGEAHDVLKDAGNTWVAEASAASVEATFIRLGLDIKEPIELQKDFAYVRTSRVDSEDRRKIVVSTITKWGLGLFLAAVSAGSGVIAALKIKP